MSDREIYTSEGAPIDGGSSDHSAAPEWFKGGVRLVVDVGDAAEVAVFFRARESAGGRKEQYYGIYRERDDIDDVDELLARAKAELEAAAIEADLEIARSADTGAWEQLDQERDRLDEDLDLERDEVTDRVAESGLECASASYHDAVDAARWLLEDERITSVAISDQGRFAALDDVDVVIKPSAVDAALVLPRDEGAEVAEQDRPGITDRVRDRARSLGGVATSALRSPLRAAQWVRSRAGLEGRRGATSDERDDQGAVDGDQRDDQEGADEESEDQDQEDLEELLEDEWLVEWKHARMDLAATISYSDLAWNLIAPAIVVMVGLLMIAQIWVVPWLYLPIIGVSLLVGIANYYRVYRKRRARLDRLRQDSEATAWGDAAALVKEIEVPETTMYYGWVAGRLYAHPDREIFARELSRRLYEQVNGIEISPSILEKYGHQLKLMYPNLYDYRDDEKQRIMRLLRQQVEESTVGLLPKQKLIEDTVEHGIKRGHLSRRRSATEGYDPALVREAYKELVPAALVEQEITVEQRDDGGGETTVTAVRLREDPLPPEFSEIRVKFSEQFGNYARWEPMYRLPDVDDQLAVEPVYVGGKDDPPEVERHV